jgi:hypothetical protein
MVETDKGSRVYLSVTVAPRRYRDEQTGNWKYAQSYSPLDLSTLILAPALGMYTVPSVTTGSERANT